MPNNFLFKVLSAILKYFLSVTKDTRSKKKKILKKLLCWEDREDSISDVTVFRYIKLTD